MKERLIDVEDRMRNCDINLIIVPENIAMEMKNEKEVIIE